MVRSAALPQRVSNHAGRGRRTVLRDATQVEPTWVAPQDEVRVRLPLFSDATGATRKARVTLQPGRLANGLATSRAHSIKSLTAGLRVRFFRVKIATRCGGTPRSIGSTFTETSASREISASYPTLLRENARSRAS